ncbi:MAG: serpin family protein [Lachnospiraceae bacterium]|nr:serpin family protein [Lachnospiraceae bacterium]
MLNKKILSKLIIATVLLTTLFSFTGCNGSISQNEKDLLANVKDSEKEQSSQNDNQNIENDIKNNTQNDTQFEQIHYPCISEVPNTTEKIMDVSVGLFQNSFEEKENTLLSPISILSALSMTANGARGETLEQMQMFFGMTKEQLTAYLSEYQKQLSQAEHGQLHMANSLWISNKGDLKVNQEFLQANTNDYKADIYEVPLDNTTVNDINLWVKDKTKGMITQLLDEIPIDTVMYLINALAFEAEWEEKYNEYSVNEAVFQKEDGTTQPVSLMYSRENAYLADDEATGFIKYYKDRNYAFVALLPNEDVSVEEYVTSLTGTRLKTMLEQPTKVPVNVAIPKFESTFEVEMKDILKTFNVESIPQDFVSIIQKEYNNNFANHWDKRRTYRVLEDLVH